MWEERLGKQERPKETYYLAKLHGAVVFTLNENLSQSNNCKTQILTKLRNS